MQAPLPDTGQSKRHRWWVLLAIATLVTIFAAPRAARLRIEADLSKLLPAGRPATAAYLGYLSHFGGSDVIFIGIRMTDEGSDQDDLIEASDRLVTALRDSGLVRQIRAGLTSTDEEFLLTEVVPRLFLRAADTDRETLERRLRPDAIHRRLRWMRAQLQSPLAPAWQSRLFAADPFGLTEQPTGAFAATPAGMPIDPMSGRFLSPDGRVALILAMTATHEMDSRGGRLLVDELNAAFRTVEERSASGLELFALGGPLYAAHEERAIRRDLTRSVATSAVAITLLLALYFGRSIVPPALALAIFAGLLWAAAVPVTVYGGLSAIGISFGSILLGLGIDYGIHGAVAFQRRILQGDSADRGMRAAIRQVLPAIAASVATTATGFLVLTGAGFSPLRELGVVVAAGVVLMAVAFFVLGAPLMVLWRRPQAAQQRGSAGGPAHRPVERFVGFLTAIATHRPRSTLAVIAMLTVLAVGGWRHLDFAADLSSLRTAERPLQTAEEQLSRHFGLGAETLAVTVGAADLDAAIGGARQTAALVRRRLPDATVSSPSDWLTDRRTVSRQLRAWPEFPALLASALTTFDTAQADFGFAPDAFADGLRIMRSIALGDDPPPVPISGWPDWLAQLVDRQPDRVRVAINVRAAEGSLDPQTVRDLAEELTQVEGDAAVAAIDLVADEMKAATVEDLRRLSLWCVVAVALVILLSFRGNPVAGGLAILPVLVGCAWMLGVAGWAGVVLTPFAVMVIPVVVGIGVDDGLHVVHGRTSQGSLSRAAVISGGAMTLTSATTCLAFGSLALSGIPGLRQGGLLVALGTLTCLLVTLTALPAIGALPGARR